MYVKPPKILHHRDENFVTVNTLNTMADKNPTLRVHYLDTHFVTVNVVVQNPTTLEY